jgi:hypothetical protein
MVLLVLTTGTGAIETGVLTHQQWDQLHERFHADVSQLWGTHDPWREHPTLLAHYSADLLSRSLVDFEAGTVRVEQLGPDRAPIDDTVARTALEGEVLQLLRYCNTCPMRMAKGQLDPAFTPAPSVNDQLVPHPASNSHIYRLHPGDTLSSIATRFGISVSQLEAANQEQLVPLQWKVDMALRIPEPTRRPPPGPQSLLEGQLRQLAGESVTASSLESFAARVIREGKLYDRVATGDDGSVRSVMGTVFQLADDHLAVRSRAYLPIVRQACERYQIPVGLAMAVMHVESAFNPRAISRSQAYGLMQIMPRTAGREAYALVYGRKAVPTPRELLTPNTNIELGVAYLHLLGTRYFSDVPDLDGRRACMVSAYNAGPGAVRAVLERLPDAVLQDASQIARHLAVELPSRESRDYLPAVLALLPRYNVLDAILGDSTQTASTKSERPAHSRNSELAPEAQALTDLGP